MDEKKKKIWKEFAKMELKSLGITILCLVGFFLGLALIFAEESTTIHRIIGIIGVCIASVGYATSVFVSDWYSAKLVVEKKGLDK